MGGVVLYWKGRLGSEYRGKLSSFCIESEANDSSFWFLFLFRFAVFRFISICFVSFEFCRGDLDRARPRPPTRKMYRVGGGGLSHTLLWVFRWHFRGCIELKQ